MAFLSTQTISLFSLDPVYSSAGGSGDTFFPGDKTFLHVRNGGGGSITVTVDDPNSIAPDNAAEFDPDIAVVIAPAGSTFVGPFTTSRFSNTSGYVEVTYSSVTSVTIAVFKISS